MTRRIFAITGLLLSVGVAVSGCGSFNSITDKSTTEANKEFHSPSQDRARKSSVFDLFGNRDDPNISVQVNKYLWNASLDVLNFMPIQSADPFSGILVMGYGTPPGGGRSYRATVLVRDPALDARSLSISLQTRGGPASVDTVRAIEDAIMTRARQLRIRDSKL